MSRPGLRAQAERRSAWLAERLDTLVPELMDRHDVDAWILTAREYNEDPVLSTMLPPTWLGTARRRTILAFTDRGRSRVAIARYDVGDAFPGIWDPEAQPDQWACLAAHLDTADPGRVAVNRSPAEAFADGLSAAEHAALMAALPERFAGRLVPAARLAVEWLETRIPAEMGAYRDACQVAHEILATGLSAKAVEPGATTTDDLAWWLREEVRARGLAVWFHPTVSVQRASRGGRRGFSAPPADATIEPGDLVHVDFGIVYAGLHTDQQQHAYVLRPGETSAPPGLRVALAAGNRLQDLLLAEFALGRTGNDVLAATRKAAAAAGIDASVYTHPIGLHGHGAGPTIGLWDSQDGVPGGGDLPLRASTAWSIELATISSVPEWDGRQVRIMLEEEAFFDGDRVDWLDGRQTELHLI